MLEMAKNSSKEIREYILEKYRVKKLIVHLDTIIMNDNNIIILVIQEAVKQHAKKTTEPH